MGKVLDLRPRLARVNAIAYQDSYVIVHRSGRLEYTDQGYAEFADIFHYAGIVIEEVDSLAAHQSALEKIDFKSLVPFG